MTATSAMHSASDQYDIKLSLASEVRDTAHRGLIRVAGIVTWLSAFDLLWRTSDYTWPICTMVLLGLGTGTSSVLRHRHPQLARTLLASILLAAYFMAILNRPDSPARYVGTLVMIALPVLLPLGMYLLMGVMTCGGLVLLEWLVPATSIGWPGTVNTILLLAASAFLSLLAIRHLSEALEWAGSSVASAQHLTQELRQRQLLLNRTLRAMDEANERLAITNQRLNEARLMANEAWQAKARFAASVSHELRTPLNLIVGFTEVMYSSPQVYEGTILSSEFLLDLGAVYRNAQHLEKLVDDVLDLAQLNTGKFALQIGPVNIADLVEEAIDTVRNLARARGLQLHAVVDPRLPLVDSDRVRIKQVLLNLLNNALRYTERGAITVKATCRNGYVSCSVTDTGPGISPEDQLRLFREFERLGEDSSSKKGFGLGLAISRRLIEALGGQISLQSQQGQGSTFTITIPHSYDVLISRPMQATGQSAAHLAGKLQDPVILVTPSPQAGRLFSRHIENYRCVVVPDGLLTEQRIASIQPRGVVVDQIVDSRTIEQLANSLARVPVQSVPLIVCPMPGEPPTGKRNKVKGYLTKPVTREDLLDVIHLIGGNIETVLVVDDDEDILRLFTRYLLEDPVHHYQVLTAQNGQQALDIIAQIVPDLILLDVVMPVMDGPALIEHLEAIPACSQASVIWVSGQDVESDRSEVEGWLRACMPRGIDATQVIRSVDSLLTALQTNVRQEG